MRQIMRWLLWGALGVLGLLIGLWVISRMQGLSASQKEALALMQERAPVPAGGNAYPALRLLAYDVPDSQLQAVTEADLAQTKLVPSPAGDGTFVMEPRTAVVAFANLAPSKADAALFCASRGDDCLDMVRSDPVVYAGLIERNQTLLDRVVALQRYGHYRSLETDPIQSSLQPLQYPAFDLTRVAWQFSNGEVDDALAGACDGAAAWRRLAAHSDSLLARSISIGNVDGYARLLARMLGEVPTSHALPASCSVAFAPPKVEDAALCTAMRGELAMSDQLMRKHLAEGAVSRLQAIAVGLTLDPNKTQALFAANQAWACTDDTKALLQQDQRIPHPGPAPGLTRLECVANPAGCVHAQVALPAYRDYQWRAQDYAARLELMAALLWLRSNAAADAPLQDQLTRYWEQQRRGQRELRFIEDGRAVTLEQWARGADESWSLPLRPQDG